ncbi:hypothetical protein [Endozoicomonas sp. SCSIO W0465]|uniref:hypothetical protein n=1 Tax=Endozoicomonas sp. SCSIO W0465 TaxID=2918516 RepID=UPI0020764EDF|nr:hypothetical protein [Endozoicomonas sp. SCSIO W0465]USE34059.1 hypothetical protein MJO57_18015 [Endozoicomonas sp. SCSIO W0465]
MAITFYSSEDAGAPQFEVTRNVSGNYQNSIDKVMDAILVTGYGSKPGCGWTKEMSSDVPDSNRTVYKNKSAHQDDMFLLVESGKENSLTIRMQIADIVTDPETYSGYSQVMAGCQTHGGQQYWMAVGDERTIIFLFYSWYVRNNSNGSSYLPYCIYAGDFEIDEGSNHKGWGLLGSYMLKGTLDTVTHPGDNRGTFGIDKKNYTFRPFTQIPGEAWSENGITINLAAFEGGSTNSVERSAIFYDVADFEANAKARSPWFMLFGANHIYRLRGAYSFYPWLRTSNSSNKRGSILITNCSTVKTDCRSRKTRIEQHYRTIC